MFKIPPSLTRWLKAIISLILVFTLVVTYPSPALANPFQNIWERLQSIFTSPSERTKGAPIGRRKGGAGRGRCPALIALDIDEKNKLEIPLTAFVPVSPIQEKQASSSELNSFTPSKINIVLGRTIEPYPTFWFYIPYVYNESEIKYGKFVLLDEQKNIVDEPVFVKLPNGNQPSLAKFTLPKTATSKPLEVNKRYSWYFSIVCNSLKPSRNPGVTGWIERDKLRIPAPQSYKYYASEGFWYDTVTRLVENTDPQKLSQQEDWLSLLKVVFKNVSDVPLDDDKLNSLTGIISQFPVQELIIESNPELL